MVRFPDVEAAFERVKDSVVQTPVMTSTTIDTLTSSEVFFKCENFQRVGAFKFRGAFNAVSLLGNEEKDRGVITHSSGNHAQALALASSKQNVRCTVVMPSSSPAVKIEATKGYGAEVVMCEPTLASRESTAAALIEEHGYTLVHAYNNPNIIAGAGTAAYELIKEVGTLDAMFAPVGGGGLLSGTSIATKGLLPKAKVIAGEPKGADDAYRSFTTGEIHPSVNPNTIADGLLTSLSELTFSIIQRYVDSIVTVSEEEIVSAMRLLWERMKIVVEPSGAVSLAALLQICEQFVGQRVGVIISGGNVDLDRFFAEFSS
ncbi:MAG: pyridoxal-phosphate dependent enzyme [Candidatus Thorarchaeota archaeon]|jgi:threonine dehydratase